MQRLTKLDSSFSCEKFISGSLGKDLTSIDVCDKPDFHPINPNGKIVVVNGVAFLFELYQQCSCIRASMFIVGAKYK
mgnify:FL=1